MRVRVLRTYARTAEFAHRCFVCEKNILPGENYEGTVYALGNGKLCVGKRHIDPECYPDLDPDPLDEHLDSMDMENSEDSKALARAA